MKTHQSKSVTNLQLVLITSSMFGALVIGSILFQDISAVVFSAVITSMVILYTEKYKAKSKKSKQNKPINTSRIVKLLVAFLLAHAVIAGLVFGWEYIN